MLSSGPFRPAADRTSLYQDRDLWLVAGIVPLNGVVILASAPKTGKTCFATALARAVAKGEPFLGKPVFQGTVLWCAHEETPQERVLLHEGLTTEDPFLIAYPGELPALPTRPPRTDRYGRRSLRDSEAPTLFEHAATLNAKLIVIDCLHAAVEGANLADNAVARAVMNTIRVWSAYLNISVLILHHLTKSTSRGAQPERFADSAQILAASSCHFYMERRPLSSEEAEDEVEDASRVILYGRGRHPAPVPKLEIISRGVLDYSLPDNDSDKNIKDKATASQVILAELEKAVSLTSEELRQRLSLEPSTIRTVLSNLQKSGQILSKRVGGRHKNYSVVSSC